MSSAINATANAAALWAVRLPSGTCLRFSQWERAAQFSAAIRAERKPGWAQDAGVIYELT